jgi:hypothetical protein
MAKTSVSRCEAPTQLTSKVLDAAWRSLLEQTIPPETHELSVKTYKRFFYAGAKALMDNLVYTDTLDETAGDATVDDMKRLDAIMHEIRAFFAEVTAGRQ